MPQRVYKNVDDVVAAAPPQSLDEAIANWPIHPAYTPSPDDWRDNVLYFLLPDRFAVEGITGQPLDRRDPETAQQNITAARPANLSWKDWCDSGSGRYQGGTIKGIQEQLPYLEKLGITTIWIGPVFRQRVEDDSYHGYGIQHFFDVDPRFGSRADLVELVRAAHGKKMHVLLDIIFNHSGNNWLYNLDVKPSEDKPGYRAEGFYSPTYPRSGMGHGMPPGSAAAHPHDFVWPTDLRDPVNYWNKGKANLGAGDPADDYAEHKLGDFETLRALNTIRDETLSALIMIFQYWIALTDCDGFRVDTVKHVSMETARNWCNAVSEHAETLGKSNFFILGEVAGGNFTQDLYLAAARNIDAVLDIGNARIELTNVAKGHIDPKAYFDNFIAGWDSGMGSHRLQGDQHVIVLDDHDHVFGLKNRLSADAPNEHQSAAATAIQLFTLGVPCIYYGTEQSLRGLPREQTERKWLTSTHTDRLLREAMFGPIHPLKPGHDGVQGQLDAALPGFGPEGTTGHHVFDTEHPAYVRIAAMADVRKAYPAARRGRQYLRNTSVLSSPFEPARAGELLAWSRVLDDREILILVNTNAAEDRGARVAVDANLAGNAYTIVCDTAGHNTTDLIRTLPVQYTGPTAFIEIPPLPPSEVLILTNDAH